jgi:hypothetical protein
MAAFTPDGKTLITASQHVRKSGSVTPTPAETSSGTHCVLVWDVEIGKPLAAPQYFKTWVAQVAVAADGKSFCTATAASENGLFKRDQGKLFEAQQWELPEKERSAGEAQKEKAR